METLLQLARYNAWANRRVFVLCQAVEPGLLIETDRGSTGSIENTLKHLVGVEDSYLLMLRDGDLQQREPVDAYVARDLDWFAARAKTLAEGYLALLTQGDASWLDGPMQMPWFDFPMTRRDGVLQAFTHSAQHRAQVLSFLGAGGVDVPDLDYVFMVGEQQRGASETF